MNKTVLIYTSVVITILIISLTSLILFFNYKEAQLKEEKKIEQIKLEQQQEEERQKKLQKCISNAENSRTNLWKANCPADNKNCSLPASTIEWIDSRYEQDIKNCNSLYK